MNIGDARTSLAEGGVLEGCWGLVNDLGVVAAAMQYSFDYYVADLQHGSHIEESLPGVMATVSCANKLFFARVRSPSFSDIGRALDLGAQGVFIPSISGIAEAEDAITATRYGPRGTRSVGRYVGNDEEPLCIIMIETGGALASAEEIIQLQGIDAIYVGPSDLALSLGGREAVGSARVRESIDEVLQLCKKHGMPVGVHTSLTEEAEHYRSIGASLVNMFVDMSAFHVALQSAMRPGH